MSVISMKQLLEAGVHFGHQTRRWNPKMKRYIFTERNGIYIIDLQKTVKHVDKAYYFIRDIIAENKTVLFVGTKKQAQEAIEEEAKRCEMYYVSQRWLGGMLTNFKTIRSRVGRLNKIEQMETSGEINMLPKKEILELMHEKQKLEKNLGGIRNMTELPGVLFVVDPKKEHIAVAEAKNLKIPVVAIVDTNCDPDEVDIVIPGNDDAIRAVKLIAAKMADAVIEARQGESFVPAEEETTQDFDSKPEEENPEVTIEDFTAAENEPAKEDNAEIKAEKPEEIKEEKEVKQTAKKPAVKAVKEEIKEETEGEEPEKEVKKTTRKSTKKADEISADEE